MSFQLFSRRRLFGRLFGGAAVLFGAGRSVVAAPIAEPTATPPLEGVMYYSYDECGRLVSIDERPGSCDGPGATLPPSPVSSWTYDDALGWYDGTG